MNDETLRDIYERCDVSNNRTDNPLSFDEFKAAIESAWKERETEVRIDELERISRNADGWAENTSFGITECVNDRINALRPTTQEDE